jgi:hypothetical protein
MSKFEFSRAKSDAKARDTLPSHVAFRNFVFFGAFRGPNSAVKLSAGGCQVRGQFLRKSRHEDDNRGEIVARNCRQLQWDQVFTSQIRREKQETCYRTTASFVILHFSVAFAWGGGGGGITKI